MLNGVTLDLAAAKIAKNCTPEEIEEMFKPVTGLDLLLRLDYEGAKQKVSDWFLDMSPDAMPHRFRSGPARQMDNAIDFETLYRKIKELTTL